MSEENVEKGLNAGLDTRSAGNTAYEKKDRATA
jgi:hypothetical protein